MLFLGEFNRSSRHLRRTITAITATFLVGALGACGGSWATESGDSVADTTGDQITLTVYSGRSEALVSELFAQFTAQTGIEISARYGDSGEMAALLLTEGRKTPADVFFSQDAGALGAVSDAELLATLPSALIELVGESYRSRTGTWVATSGRARVVVYNPTLVDTPPTSVDDLLDPKWSGKIGFVPTNASWQSFVTALRVIRGEDAARKWLESFAANKPVAYEKNAVVVDAVNAAEVALGLTNHYYLYQKIAAEGVDKVVAKNHFFTNGDVGGLVNVAGVGVLASTRHEQAAQKFVQFLLSVKGQEYLANKTYEYPLVAGVSQYAELPSLAELNPPAIDLADLKSIEKTQELLSQTGLLTK